MLAGLVMLPAIAFASPDRSAMNAAITNESGLGVIRGVVRDEGGSPIADATVAIFRAGTSRLLKQVSSAADGSFIARIIPGTYTVLAVAQGFNPVTVLGVEVSRSTQLNYGFKLERAGGGNTLPEKRADRHSSKWRIRAAQMQRSIYQNREGKTPVDETAAASNDSDKSASVADDLATNGKRPRQTVVETYFAGSAHGNFSGVNFATLLPAGETASIVIAGQTGTGRNAPQSLQTNIKFHSVGNHQIRLGAAAGKFGTMQSISGERSLGQVSLQATDEWKVRDGVILVLGFDYSRFLGGGTDSSLSPRFGLQFDVNAKTRIRTGFSTQTQEKTWSRAIKFEGESVALSEPVSVEDLIVVGGKPRMNKSSRFEFGVERVIDNRSSIEANAFFDMTAGRGVGLTSIGIDSLRGDGFGEIVGDQQGRAQGLRFVYTRRLDGPFTLTAGYSLGSGQRLSNKALSNPAALFETSFFQSFFGQLGIDLKSGTSIQTVFRLSPQATVFAIDPFKGRLAIYDPGLSILVTQSLPTLGLPIRAEAIVDARNVFNFQPGISGDEGSLRLSAQRRMLRGGILVRF